ncbi:MAG TPA: S-layer protein, partial [Planctomycetaceae bacterium]|nr:S-layer protein [Planctomycetaceae bacterium]
MNPPSFLRRGGSADRFVRFWLVGLLALLGQVLFSPRAWADDVAKSRPFHFETDVLPILSRFGCNSSGCHGKAEGQNGFKLSIFGFDPQADHVALASEGRGRRTNPVMPEKSLLLQKACGDIPHGGGVRIRKSSEEYGTLATWIAAGLPYGDATAPRVSSIT